MGGGVVPVEQDGARAEGVLITPDRALGEALAVACARHALTLRVLDPASDLRSLDGEVVVLDLVTEGAAVEQRAADIRAAATGRVLALIDGRLPADLDVPVDGCVDADVSVSELVTRLADRPADPSPVRPRSRLVGLTVQEVAS